MTKETPTGESDGPGDAAAPADGPPAGELRDDVRLLAVLLGFLALLEWRHPYYFLQDDNRTMQLGLFAHLLRSLSLGELPLYDFHQFLGVSAFGVGPVAVFYPPAYAAALASRALLGHVDAAIDLVVAFHLAIAVVGMRRLLRRLGLSPWASAFGALTWPLSSMIIGTATSWWQVTAVAAYLPWTILLGLRTLRRPRLSAIVALVGARGLFLFAGHAQFFVYSTCFEVLCVGLAAWTTTSPRRSLPRALAPYGLSLYLTAALALPFLQPLWAASIASGERAAPLAYAEFHEGAFDLLSWTRGVVEPYGVAPGYAGRPSREAFEPSLPTLSFLGYLVLVLLAAAPSLLRRPHGARLPVRVFAIPALVAFSWMAGGLDRLLYAVPMLNRLRWPFKLNVFVAFFLLVVVAIAFDAAERALASRLGARRARAAAAAALAAQLLSLAALYLGAPPHGFNYRPMRERPPLVEPLRDRLAGARIVSLGHLSSDPFSRAQVGYDYASLFGLVQYGGYANLLPRRHDALMRPLIDPARRRMRADAVWKLPEVPFDELERWGVAWYVLAKNAADPDETERYRAQLLAHGALPVAEDAQRIVYRDPAAEPLVGLVDGDRREALVPALGGTSLAVRFPPAAHARTVVASFLAMPGFHAEDREGRELELNEDRFARMVVNVPAGVAGVRLVYREPALRPAVRNAAVLLVLPLLVLAALRFPIGARREDNGRG